MEKVTHPTWIIMKLLVQEEILESDFGSLGVYETPFVTGIANIQSGAYVAGDSTMPSILEIIHSTNFDF